MIPNPPIPSSNLPVVKQNTDLALSNANMLMDVANKILSEKSTELVDESWMQRLWDWADGIKLASRHLPRSKERLCKMERLRLPTYGNFFGYDYIPEEIGHIPNLTSLEIDDYYHGYNLAKAIKKMHRLQILNLKNVSINRDDLLSILTNAIKIETLSLRFCNIDEIPKEISKLENLNYLELWGSTMYPIKLHDSITTLTGIQNLVIHDPSLLFTEKQIQWIKRIGVKWIRTPQLNIRNSN